MTGASGEESILTFTLSLEDTLTTQYRLAPLMSQQWRLRSITGEAALAEPPTSAHPCLPPEAVVEAQLAALQQQDARGVYAFASPSNKYATGGSIERFATLLRNPLYRPLMGHQRATSLQRLQASATQFLEVVEVLSHNTGMPRGLRLMYLWQLELQPGAPGDSEYAACWMTTAVQPVHASSVE